MYYHRNNNNWIGDNAFYVMYVHCFVLRGALYFCHNSFYFHHHPFNGHLWSLQISSLPLNNNITIIITWLISPAPPPNLLFLIDDSNLTLPPLLLPSLAFAFLFIKTHPAVVVLRDPWNNLYACVYLHGIATISLECLNFRSVSAS